MMKKVILGVFVLILLSSTAFTVEISDTNNIQQGNVTLSNSFYSNFYNIDPIAITASYHELRDSDASRLSREQKKSYKNIKKAQKYIAKKEFKKALKAEPNSLPVHIQYMNFLLKNSDYSNVLTEMQKIKALNAKENILNSQVIDYKLGMLNYLNRNYADALSLLSPFVEKPNPSVENLWFALGDIYYNLKDYNNSILYAKKIDSSSYYYNDAQVLLYNDYYSLNNLKDANSCAKILVKKDPSPVNYMRLGSTSGSDSEKLANYYKARDIAEETEDYAALAQADIRIASTEQKKIDDSIKNLSGFVEKPDWNKILKEAIEYSEPVELSRRQVEFFKSANNCMDKYKNQDLIKCYESVNREQDKITDEVKSKYESSYYYEQ